MVFTVRNRENIIHTLRYLRKCIFLEQREMQVKQKCKDQGKEFLCQIIVMSYNNWCARRHSSVTDTDTQQFTSDSSQYETRPLSYLHSFDLT